MISVLLFPRLRISVLAVGCLIGVTACASSQTDRFNGEPPSSNVDGGTRTDSGSIASDGGALTCGNSALETGETCDDGNAAQGDGCSATCKTEPLYICVGAGPGSCTLTPGAWAQEAYVKASNTTRPHSTDATLFGNSVALSTDGTTLAVGSSGEPSPNSGINTDQNAYNAYRAGAVYVFRRTASTWAQEAYIKASNAASNHNFGASVALSANGDTLAVGAYGEAGASPGVNGNQALQRYEGAGAVYTFQRVGSTWGQGSYLKASNPRYSYEFGRAIALSDDGHLLAVGSPNESSASEGIDSSQAYNTDAYSAGAVYLFRSTGITWVQEAYVKASNTTSHCRVCGNYFGSALALSSDGSTLAVGAYGEQSSTTGVNGLQTDNSMPDAGAVYMFRRAARVWAQDAYVKASNTQAFDCFGWSVALSSDGQTLAVGAVAEGSAALGVNGDQANNDAQSAGAVYLFQRSGTGWAQQAYLKASNAAKENDFGGSVTLSGDGNTLAVGAVLESSAATGLDGNQRDNSAGSAGAVYVFHRAGTGNWAQENYMKASNTGARDQFGNSVSLAGDGRHLAVGAFHEGSNATGINGNQADNTAPGAGAGAVYMFTR